jgi:uroporphyrinogen III methyltransferase/synthase
VEALVSLVGAGPGDPSLITLAGVRALTRADVVLYDALVHRALLDHAPANALRIFVGKRAGHEGARQQDIHGLILEHVTAGRRVCRLKGGDPLLFGRGSEEAEFLREHGISFEIVPGVSSVLGATAYAGIPLTHRTHSSSVAFITSSEHAQKSESAHDWSRLANGTQTLVLFMGVRRVRQEMQRLIDHGRPASTPAAAIEWGTFSRQRVVVSTVGGLADECEAEGLGPPALVIVGEVVSLRERLRWWDVQPLIGINVAITRPADQQRELTRLLTEQGAEPMPFAAVELCDGPDAAQLAHAVRHASSYDLVAFSSANAVDRFFATVASEGLDARTLGRAKVVSIGAATTRKLATYGIRADATAEESVGEGLVAAIHAALGGAVAGARVLVPRAAKGREVIVKLLRDADADVDAIAAYDTRPSQSGLAPLRAALEAGTVDALVFSSGSGLDAVCATLGEDALQLLAPVTIASIGPVTSAAIRAKGLTVACEARTASDEAIVEALVAHYRAARR